MIDSGTKDSARVIYEKLKILEAWPVERVIITHSHWDHTQGLGFLREKAAETGHSPGGIRFGKSRAFSCRSIL